eukprot:gb/GECG01015017.1/.p1 GENE.gb/GECG01015017.1/~~gb/GECG01015017.1/.p1  ORF type:complete len:459 (+),score=62.13 gb/GECG01015017.1/:1-1377(+)
MEWETYQVPVLLLVLVATVLFVFYSYGPLSTTKTQEEVTLESRSETEQKPQHGSSTGTKASTQQPGKSMNKLVQEANKKMAAKEKTPEHPLFSRIFRSGKSPITAFAVSSHGKVVALGTQDTSIHIIFINRPKESSGNQPSFKLNIEFDFASALAFSEDEKILCVATHTDRRVLVYHVPSKKAPGKAPELKSSFETGHKAVITDLNARSFAALPASLFITTSCREKEDTHVYCWSPKTGECIARVDTAQVQNHKTVISPSGQLLAVPAWTNEVKVWRCEQKEGALRSLKKLFSLQGHKRSVADICFVPHDKRLGSGALDRLAVTASCEGTFKLWDLNVRVEVNEDPRLVDTHQVDIRDSVKQVLLFPQSLQAARDGKLDDLKFAVVDASVIRVIKIAIRGTLEPYSAIEPSTVTWKTLGELDLQEFGVLREISILESGAEIATFFDNSKALKLWKVPC